MYSYGNVWLNSSWNVSDKSCTENQNTHFMCSITILSENRAVYEIMWRNYCRARLVTDGDITRLMRLPCWIPKATNTYLEYAIIIVLIEESPLCFEFKSKTKSFKFTVKTQQCTNIIIIIIIIIVIIICII